MEEMRLADERLNVLEHPLIAHKMSIMRDGSTAPSQFRQLVHEVAMLEVYEASRDLAMEPVEVETPLQRTAGKRIAGEKLAVVPILRAGMGMLDGVLSVIPSAAVGVLGMERDEQTHQPHEYYAKMPRGHCRQDGVFDRPHVGHRRQRAFGYSLSARAGRSRYQIPGAGGCPRRGSRRFAGRPRCSHLDVRAG